MTKKLTANILEFASSLPENWLVGCSSRELLLKVDRQFQKITQLDAETPLKVCIAEPDSINFIASFIAACATKCQIFLCNPNWVKSEWQQAFDLIYPDIILGEYALQNSAEQHSIAPPPNNHKNHPQFPIPNSQFPLIMIPTGGSSGKIRFAVHNWETLTASVRGFQEHFHLSQINSFCVLPLYHVSGLMQLLRSFTTSGKLAIQSFKSLENGEKFDIEPEKFFISLVPTQLQRLLQKPDTANWLSQFHTVLLGGAPAWPELLTTARNCQIKLALTYGMTETASQIATLKPEDFLAGNNSSGQILPHAKVTIRGGNGEILSYNETGNICINAKSLALGYYPENWRNSEYLQLDDLGFFDKNNFLNIVGRNSDKIITGGENVFPIEVEAAIRSTDLVTDICTIGLPDKHWGQAVTAVYVPANSQVTVTALQRAIEDKLSKFKRPKYWIAVAQLPRNSQGKINRKQLHELAAMSTERSI
jgi:o-succinylbenzoate---CoA ligase